MAAARHQWVHSAGGTHLSAPLTGVHILRTVGPINGSSPGPPDRRRGHRVCPGDPVVCWPAGLRVCWSAEWLNCRYAGLLGGRTAGLKVCWYADMLVCWPDARLAGRTSCIAGDCRVLVVVLSKSRLSIWLPLYTCEVAEDRTLLEQLLCGAVPHPPTGKGVVRCIARVQ